MIDLNNLVNSSLIILQFGFVVWIVSKVQRLSDRIEEIGKLISQLSKDLDSLEVNLRELERENNRIETTLKDNGFLS